MAIVILGLIALSALLYEPLSDAFAANIFLNGLILGVLLLGILYNFRQVVLLYPEVNWIERFRLNTETSPNTKEPRLLAPMVTMLSSQKNKISLSTHSMRSLLAVVLASINIFGGFIVTQRMLQMFKKKSNSRG